MADRGDADSEGIRDRISGRGEDALGEIAQILMDNPLLHQGLQMAVEARDRATKASAGAMRSLNVPAATDVDRLGRRIRALSERLEVVEDELDRLTRAVQQGSAGPPATPKDSGHGRGFEGPPSAPQEPPRG